MEEKDRQLLLRAVDEIKSLRQQTDSAQEQLSIVRTFRALILKEQGGWMGEDIVSVIMKRIYEPHNNEGIESEEKI